MASFGSIKSAIFDREEKKQFRRLLSSKFSILFFTIESNKTHTHHLSSLHFKILNLNLRQYQAHIRGLNAYDRHKKFLNDYVGFCGKEKSTDVKFPVKTDHDTLREGYRFIRSEEDDMNPYWEQKLVKRYYDKLFKEYCIADMSQYRSGQFLCGNKHCNEKDGLASYEVNFSYFEAGENKQALVKLVTCERCAEKLHYKKRKEELERKQKKEYKRKRDQSKDKDDTDEEYERSREKRKGNRASSSAVNRESDDDDDDDEDFDRYLEGMFL